MNCQLKDSILGFDRPVPRYTSYPTAPHFQKIEDADLYAAWLRNLSPKARLSLYLHVPFCPKMCWYCGCHTKITQRYAPVEDYVHLLMREMEILKDHIPKGCVVGHVHFGGGSPGMLRASDFAKLMEKFRACYNVAKDAEIAIEIDPRGVTEGRVAAYAAAGVNRISLGVQDFDETVLKSVNRAQPFHLSYDAVRLFRGYGIRAVNVDVMYGLPHQTQETMAATMEKVLLLDPDRIAFFGYAHVPWMKKHMTLIDAAQLPDKSVRYDLFENGAARLEAAGYAAIGLDHFAKPEDSLTRAQKAGKLKRNFQGYTTDDSDALIGLGGSAIGRFSQGYVQNAIERPVYESMVLGGQLPAQKFCTLRDEDTLRAAVIERLMCDFTADIPAICEKHGFPENHLDREMCHLAPYEAQGFVVVQGGVVAMNPKARPMVRLVCAVFDEYLPAVQDTPRNARAV